MPPASVRARYAVRRAASQSFLDDPHRDYFVISKDFGWREPVLVIASRCPNIRTEAHLSGVLVPPLVHEFFAKNTSNDAAAVLHYFTLQHPPVFTEYLTFLPDGDMDIDRVGIDYTSARGW